MSAFDIIVVIALGSAVGDVMIYGEDVVLIIESMVAIATVMILVIAFDNLIAKAPANVVRFIEGDATVLVKNGRVDEKALETVNINPEELKTLLREKNIHKMSDIRLCILEPNGYLSVIKHKKKRLNSKLL